MKCTLKHVSIFALLVIFGNFCFHSFGQDVKNQSGLNLDSSAVAKTVTEFVDAFTNLNWKKFSECFADDATAFFPPSANFPFRANNKKEVEKIFRNVFDNARKQKTIPPYIVIEPKDLKIQMIGKVAIVTFVLNDPDLFGRRTIVFRKENNKWSIIHLHASGVMIPK